MEKKCHACSKYFDRRLFRRLKKVVKKRCIVKTLALFRQAENGQLKTAGLKRFIVNIGKHAT